MTYTRTWMRILLHAHTRIDICICSTESVATAMQILRDISAVDTQERLTPLGGHLAAIPADLRIGIFKCSQVFVRVWLRMRWHKIKCTYAASRFVDTRLLSCNPREVPPFWCYFAVSWSGAHRCCMYELPITVCQVCVFWHEYLMPSGDRFCIIDLFSRILKIDNCRCFVYCT